MKKLLFLAFGLIPSFVFAQFSDLSADHENSDAILYMKTEKIVQGYGDGSFKPQNKINRAELTKIIVSLNFEAQEIEDCDKNELGFSDVDVDTWFAPFICTAKANGLISGYDDGTFRPANTINFVEASKIISSAFRPSLSNGSDIWYRPYIEYLSRVKALPTSIAGFNHEVNRGEVSEMIYRLREKIENKPTLTWDEEKLLAPHPLETLTETEESLIENLPTIDEILLENELPNTEILPLSNAEYKDLSVDDLVLTIGQKKIALFFYADWCPSCRESDEEIKNNIGTFPNNTIVFKTSYDLETELKEKFEVTQQHTVVVINKQNEMTQKLVGFTLEELREALK